MAELWWKYISGSDRLIRQNSPFFLQGAKKPIIWIVYFDETIPVKANTALLRIRETTMITLLPQCKQGGKLLGPKFTSKRLLQFVETWIRVVDAVKFWLLKLRSRSFLLFHFSRVVGRLKGLPHIWETLLICSHVLSWISTKFRLLSTAIDFPILEIPLRVRKSQCIILK